MRTSSQLELGQLIAWASIMVIMSLGIIGLMLLSVGIG